MLGYAGWTAGQLEEEIQERLLQFKLLTQFDIELN